jgi:hypothetical protein
MAAAQAPDSRAGKHAGRPRPAWENRVWAAAWLGAAAFGALPLTQGELGVSAVYWVMTGGALLYAWLAVPWMVRGRHRGGGRRRERQ